eukprot:192244-Alexandrium_andersonii.AAC.1
MRVVACKRGAGAAASGRAGECALGTLARRAAMCNAPGAGAVRGVSVGLLAVRRQHERDAPPLHAQ